MSKILFLCLLVGTATQLVLGDEFIRWVIWIVVVYFCILFMCCHFEFCIKIRSICQPLSIWNQFSIANKSLNLFGLNSIIAQIFCIILFSMISMLSHSLLLRYVWGFLSACVWLPWERHIFFSLIKIRRNGEYSISGFEHLPKRTQFIDNIFRWVFFSLTHHSLYFLICVLFVCKLFWPHWPLYEVKIHRSLIHLSVYFEVYFWLPLSLCKCPMAQIEN